MLLNNKKATEQHERVTISQNVHNLSTNHKINSHFVNMKKCGNVRQFAARLTIRTLRTGN